MANPPPIRSTTGFRSIVFYELNASGLPLGTTTKMASYPYTVSGSLVSGSSVLVPKGTVVSGSVGYYGAWATGAKTLTINDPAPRVIPHIGEDGVFSTQVLPPLEPMSGELRMDKTNDVVDAMVGNINQTTVGESLLLGENTSKRGFENQVGALAYAFAEDTDPDSALFGSNLWDFREFPKVTVFMRETGFQQEANERMYSFTPMYVTAHMWGPTFTLNTEGYTRAQAVRGLSQYKPVIVGFAGDGATVGFPFDSQRPAASTAKIAVYKNGTLLSTGFSVSTKGVSFAVAPLVTDVLTVWYETSA